MADGNIWWLAAAPGWGAVKLRQLTDSIGDGRRILETMETAKGPEEYLNWVKTCWAMTERGAMGQPLRIEPGDMRRLWQHRTRLDICQDEFARWRAAGMQVITLLDETYPRRLREIYDPPFALYVRGQLPQEDRKTAAVVGARACSGYGANQGRRIARELAAQGVQIISGLAYGVDSEGHWGALDSGVKGATYAILGCSVERCYPPDHEKLAEKILENGGGLISEYPPGTDPHPGHFPMRNRIISGMSDCILVMEARRRSGSLITVDQALEQGREVFALPGRVGDKLSEGCLHLIRHGANVLLESGDVMRYLYPEYGASGDMMAERMRISSKNAKMKNTACVSGEKERGRTEGNNSAKKRPDEEKNCVYGCLDCVGKTVEEIMELTGLPLAAVRMQLLELLLEGQIVETVKGYYSIEL